MDRETRNLEYKEEITKSFLKTVSAFSNFGTGRIIFGVTDDKAVIGLKDVEQKCLDIENTINDNINPIPDYQLKINEDDTIELIVKEGLYKPYLYKNKAYKRSDSFSVEVDRLEFNKAKTGRILKRLIEQEIIEKIGKGKDTKYQLNI